MENKICIECKHLNRELAFCRACGAKWLKDTDGANCKYFEKITKPTVFDKITESVETLAPCFVEKQIDQWDDDDYAYYSYLTKEWYATEDKALAATIEELKKEYKK